MAVELEVHNFQSIKHSTIVVDGFIGVEGPTNIGKSAFVRAVGCALTNPVGTNFVRHGATCDRLVKGSKKCKCFSRVIIRMKDLTVTWEKGDGINRYTVIRPGASSPEVYEGLEQGTPEFLLPGFKKIKVGDSNGLVQIPDQFDPIFLLNCSGPAVASVVSDVARLDRLNVAAGMALKDKKEAAAKLKVREGDIKEIRKSLSEYDGIDDLDVSELQEVLRTLDSKRARLKFIDDVVVRVQDIREVLVRAAPVAKVVVPTFDPVSSLQAAFEQVSRFWGRLPTLQAQETLLTKVLACEVPEILTLKDLSAKYARAEKLLSGFEEQSQSTRTLSKVEDLKLPELSSLEERQAKFLKVDGWFSRLRTEGAYYKRALAVETVKVPEVQRLSDLVARFGQVQQWFSSLEDLEDQVRQLQAEVRKAEEGALSVKQELESLGMCPTCTQPLGSHPLHLED